MKSKKLTCLLTTLFVITYLPTAWSQATPTPVIGTPSAPVTPYVDLNPSARSGTSVYIDPYLRDENARMAWQAEHGINIYNDPQSNLFTKTGTAVKVFFDVKNKLSAETNYVETGKALIDKYKADAEQGKEEKMLYMALTYWIYLHDKQNEIIWLDKLVTLNNDYALMRRGDLFEDAKEIDNSIALYERAAKAGSITAMTGLAEKYILYRKDEINKPVELLTAAAAKNYIDACLELANLYTGGYGKQYPVNYTNAINLYQKYIQLTDAQTMNADIPERITVMKNIAAFYKNGYGVPVDKTAYRHWMKRARAENERF